MQCACHTVGKQNFPKLIAGENPCFLNVEFLKGDVNIQYIFFRIKVGSKSLNMQQLND